MPQMVNVIRRCLDAMRAGPKDTDIGPQATSLSEYAENFPFKEINQIRAILKGRCQGETPAIWWTQARSFRKHRWSHKHLIK